MLKGGKQQENKQYYCFDHSGIKDSQYIAFAKYHLGYSRLYKAMLTLLPLRKGL